MTWDGNIPSVVSGLFNTNGHFLLLLSTLCFGRVCLLNKMYS